MTDLGAVDTELGVLKTGKEADVHLLERAVPGAAASSLLAAKRYRVERAPAVPPGRRLPRGPARPALARDPRDGDPHRFGRDISPASGRAPSSAPSAGSGSSGAGGRVRVPYPVQLLGTELLLEFIGDADGTAAPRLAQAAPGRRRAAGALAAAGRRADGARPGRARARRPVAVQRARAPRPARPHRPAAGRGRRREPAGAGVPARDVATSPRWFAARGLDLDDGDARTSPSACSTDAGLR